jgi:NTP pyrophosphatase (non-canonical NTP hydrolase)
MLLQPRAAEPRAVLRVNEVSLNRSKIRLPLDLHQIQEFHEKLDEAEGFDRDPMRNVAYFAEELGEVSRAVRRLGRAAASETERLCGDLAEELADCLAYLAKIANYHAIDLEAAYLEKMRSNEARDWHAKEQRGGVGPSP